MITEILDNLIDAKPSLDAIKSILFDSLTDAYELGYEEGYVIGHQDAIDEGIDIERDRED